MGRSFTMRRAFFVLAAVSAASAAWAAVAIPEQKLGAHFAVSPAHLAAPNKRAAASNPAEHVDRNGAMPTVPVGFQVNVFASGLSNPRWMAVAPNGDVFLAESEARQGHASSRR